MKAYVLDILREIRHSMGRFFSIMAIVAIGVAFFAGVKASIPDMKYTADAYFDDYNLMDIRMVSTMGFTKEDVKAMKEVDGIEGIMPTFAMDFLTHRGTQQYVVKAIAKHYDETSNPNYINQFRLIEGRMPEKPNECLLEEQSMIASGFQIGDMITLESGTKDPLNKTLKEDTYKIVGTAFTPDYLSDEKGTSAIGSGKVDLFIVIDADNYISDYYSEVLITVKGAKEHNSYSDDYFDVIDPINAALAQVGDERSDIRYEEIKEIANEKYQEGEVKYQVALTEFETQIEEARNQLESARDELLLGRAQLESGKANLASSQMLIEMQIIQNETNLTQYETQLEEIVALKDQMHERYDPIIKAMNEEIISRQKKIDELYNKLNDSAISEEQKAQIKIQIQFEERQMEVAKKSLETAQNAISTVDEKVAYFQQMIVNGKAQLSELRAKIASEKAVAEAQFAQAEAKLDAGEKAYIEGKIELERNEELGQKELDLAKEELESAKKQLEDLPRPTWYGLDRNSHYAYRDYLSVTERMDGIAKVFPLFFLLVCALVCLTTMTRMVDEQRGMIGTYKALGYSKVAIAMKYVVYALVAGITGSVVGCLVGMTLFPTVIFNAWNLMYNLPSLQFELQLPLAIQSSISVLSVTVLATIFACYKELVEVPALLMRPKAPKNGKKILLERIPFLWKRFSFTWKVTARNIFRYKKRFFMTVIGISGCTALLVAGFGIQDSIAQIVDKQFGEIIQYDAMLSFTPDSTYVDRDDVERKLKDDTLVKDMMGMMQENVTVADDGEETAVSIIVPEDSHDLEEFVSLINRQTKEQLHLSADGVIATEKLTKNLGVGVGDYIPITLANGVVKEVKISGIMENYVGHTLYMTSSYYKQISHERAVPNAIYLKMKHANQANEQKLGNKYMKLDSVTSLSFYRGIADGLYDTIASISFVVYVLIGAAGLLAFVVLYNLTNVNISERMREIATIKVLGFYPGEVASYVYRENIVLTMIGGVCGLLLGVGLHALIMNLAEMPEIMFGRNIEPFSFMISFALTLLFSLIVSLVMYRKLKQIPMVESLKSVE